MKAVAWRAMVAALGVLVAASAGASAQEGKGWARREDPAAKKGWGTKSSAPPAAPKVTSGAGWGSTARPGPVAARMAPTVSAPPARPRPSPAPGAVASVAGAGFSRPAEAVAPPRHASGDSRAAEAPAAFVTVGGVPIDVAAPLAPEPVAAPEAPPAASTPPAQPATVAAVARRSVPTGLERLSDEWPRWVKVGVQYRGRSEGASGLAGVKGRDDTYYLNRVRLDASVIVSPAARIVLQAQDAQTLGFDGAVHPASMTNTFDLRQAYLDVLPSSGRGLGARVGRQELAFGEQRLVGHGEWNNTARTFDAVKASIVGGRGRLDVFAASVVRVEQGRFDRHRTDERLFGGVATLAARAISGVVEPYVFVRHADVAAGELGAVGQGRLYASGIRVAGKFSRRTDFGLETVMERGHAAGDPVSAWAGHYVMGWTIGDSSRRPRAFVEFNQASGDASPDDGRRQTFDQLYPTNHGKYGQADLVGWRNMRDLAAGFEFAPVSKWKVTTSMHRLWLATVADGLYNAAGVRTVLNRQAVSPDVGTEYGVATSYAFSKELSLGAGFGYLVPGAYLVESTGATAIWTPYVMWSVKF